MSDLRINPRSSNNQAVRSSSSVQGSGQSPARTTQVNLNFGGLHGNHKQPHSQDDDGLTMSFMGLDVKASKDFWWELLKNTWGWVLGGLLIVGYGYVRGKTFMTSGYENLLSEKTKLAKDWVHEFAIESVQRDYNPLNLIATGFIGTFNAKWTREQIKENLNKIPADVLKSFERRVEDLQLSNLSDKELESKIEEQSRQMRESSGRRTEDLEQSLSDLKKALRVNRGSRRNES